MFSQQLRRAVTLLFNIARDDFKIANNFKKKRKDNSRNSLTAINWYSTGTQMTHLSESFTSSNTEPDLEACFTVIYQVTTDQ